jgi:hypothetical protein
MLNPTQNGPFLQEFAHAVHRFERESRCSVALLKSAHKVSTFIHGSPLIGEQAATYIYSPVRCAPAERIAFAVFLAVRKGDGKQHARTLTHLLRNS